MRLPHSGSAAGVCLACLIASASGQEPTEDKPEMSLPPVSVRGIHVAADLPADRMRVQVFFDLRLGMGWPDQPDALITPGRVPQTRRNIAFTTDPFAVFREETLPGEPARLRGLRALVLRDRLPAANPFDGSTSWNEMPHEGVRREIVAGGGATAWDGSAVGGAIQFFTQPPIGRLVTEPGNGRGRAIDGGPLKQHVLPTAELAASMGGLGTRRAEWAVAQPTTRGVLQVLGGIHSTNGSDVLDPTQRGAVDEPAWNRGRWLEARWRQPAGKDRELTVSLRAYENSTGHGTSEQHRREQGTRLSLAMAGDRTGGPAWNGAVYLQNDDTAATITSIDVLRLTETPARRLAGVPTSAVGASWTGAWWHLGDSRTIVGADLRHVRGESREEFGFANGSFQRKSIAGGKQSHLGLSLLQQQPLGSVVRATFGARLEAWSETSGRRRDIDRATGAVLLAQRFANDEGAGLIPGVGLVWQINKAWRLRANGQSTFRRPTLAERYQTWGIQGSITEAGPVLAAEKNLSWEAALEYGTAPGFTFGATAFHNELRDLIGSHVFPDGPASLPGLFARQRINLDRAEVQGLQFFAGRNRLGPLFLHASLLFNDTLISSFPAAPVLAGRKLARVPDRVAALNAGWKVTEELRLTFGVRSFGRQFADEENTRRLAGAILADVTFAYRLNRKAQFHLQIENIADVRRETNRDPAGLVYLGSPRVIVGGVRLHW